MDSAVVASIESNGSIAWLRHLQATQHALSQPLMYHATRLLELEHYSAHSVRRLSDLEHRVNAAWAALQSYTSGTASQLSNPSAP